MCAFISINTTALFLMVVVTCAMPDSSLAIRSTQGRRDATQSAGSMAAARQASDEAARLSYEGSERSLRAAIVRYEEAIQLYRQIGDRRNEGASLNNLGNCYLTLGDNQKAFEYCNQALMISRVERDTAGEAAALNNLGRVHDDFGDKQKHCSITIWRCPE